MSREKKENNGEKLTIKQMFSTRATRAGSYSAVAIAFVVAIAIVINLIVSALPAAYTSLDITGFGILDISEQTIDTVSSLKDDITIYHLVKSGNEDSYITQLLSRYEALSDKIKVATKDPVVYPDFAAKYTDDVKDNSLVVVCGDKYRYIDFSDIYTYDEESYYGYYYGYSDSYDTYFNGESCITGAIDLLVSDEMPTIYSITGHSDAEIDSTFLDALSQNNFTVKELNLLTVSAVPEDADCIMLVAPEKDLTENEVSVISGYLAAGGNLFLASGYRIDTELPRLTALMKEYGTSTEDGVVCEADTSKCMYSNQYGYLSSYFIPTMGNHDITDPISNYNVAIVNAKSIEVPDNVSDTLSITTLLSTSSSGYLQVFNKDSGEYETPEDETGREIVVGVAISKALGGDGNGAAAAEDVTAGDAATAETTAAQSATEAAVDGKAAGEEARIVYISSDAFISSDIDSAVSNTNSDMFVNCFGWLCNKTSAISIHAKTINSGGKLAVTSLGAAAVSVTLLAVIPVVMLLTGIIVWYRRKRR